MSGDPPAHTKEFWRANFYNEAVYTRARMKHRRPVRGGARTMVNVGSHLAVDALPFVLDGWRVFAFEPNPDLADGLRRIEQEHANFTFIPKAVSASPATRAEFFVSMTASGMSSLVNRTPDSRVVSVETTTLQSFCRDYGVDGIDYLLIDAELKDIEVFQSLGPEAALGAVTLEFGGNLLPAIHAAVTARCPSFKEIVFEYRKPLGPDGMEMMGVAAKCVARSTYVEYMRKKAAGAESGRWGNVFYFDPRLEPA